MTDIGYTLSSNMSLTRSHSHKVVQFISIFMFKQVLVLEDDSCTVCPSRPYIGLTLSLNKLEFEKLLTFMFIVTIILLKITYKIMIFIT